MSKRDRGLPPAPNARGDLVTEKDQRQLRETMRRKSGKEIEDEGEDMAAAGQAEGERSGEPATKVAHTPGQAEGERDEEESRKL